MMDKLIGVLLDEVRRKQAQLAGAVASGSAKDYAQYMYLCGEIRGLTAVEMYLLDLAKNMEQLDD